MDKDDYVEKRERLQREIESLRPLEYDDLIDAADMLSNFDQYWAECEKADDVQEARRQLVDKIVDRVFVYNDRVIGVALYGDFNIVLNNAAMVLKDILTALNEEMQKGAYDEASTQNGSDGHRPPSGCILYVPQNRAYHVVIRQLIGNPA